MGSSTVLLEVDTQFVDSGVQSDAPRRRDAPREPKLAVKPRIVLQEVERSAR